MAKKAPMNTKREPGGSLYVVTFHRPTKVDKEPIVFSISCKLIDLPNSIL